MATVTECATGMVGGTARVTVTALMIGAMATVMGCATATQLATTMGNGRCQGNSNGAGIGDWCDGDGYCMCNGGAPHKSHNLIYKIYNVAQQNVLLLVQLKCYV
jgi:hypothetical protein